jgi:hypothetical protein
MLADSQGGAQCEHKVDMCPCGSSLMMSDCQRTDVLGWVWELTVAWVVLCNVFLGLWYTGVEVGGGSRRWRWRSGGSVPTDWERWRTDAGLGPRDQETERLAAVTDIWGQRQAQRVHGVTMLTKSRRRSCKSSGGSGRLGARTVEDIGDTRRGLEDLWTVSGFGPQNQGCDSGGNRGWVLEEVGGQVAGSRSLRQDEAKSWCRRVRPMLWERVG